MNKNSIKNMQSDSAVQLSLFSDDEMGGFSIEEVLEAYHRCLKGKAGTYEAMEFSMNYMSNCVGLCRDLNSRSYKPSRYIVFISFVPVLREIFGSAFRDRVTDTLISEKMIPQLDSQFVDDNYSTRRNKGSLYGVFRVAEMIRRCSRDYRRDCFLLKIDIQSFFMTLNKEITMQLWTDLVNSGYKGADRELILYTLRQIIFDRPENNCVRKGHLSDWNGLPRSKSLFNSDGTCGFPIGKVISQESALLNLNRLDHILMEVFCIENGHYMDDRVMVEVSEQKLMRAKRFIDRWHQKNKLHTHPKKVYLQHFSKGVLFGGAMIMPGRIYLSNRTVGNCVHRLEIFNVNAVRQKNYVYTHVEEFATTMNSYFGLLGHFSEWNTTHRIIRSIGREWFRVMYIVGRGGKYKIRVKYDYRVRVKARRRQRQRMKELLE